MLFAEEAGCVVEAARGDVEAVRAALTAARQPWLELGKSHFAATAADAQV